MKKMTSLTLLGLTAVCLLAFTGCKSKDEAPVMKEYCSVPLYMAGQEIPGDSQEKYLSNATVKMYSLGRIADPVTGTMREAGTLYRQESVPQWNLIPQYDANPESFARNNLQEQYADPLAGQLHYSLAESRKIRNEMTHVQDDMAIIGQQYKKLAEENTNLKKELSRQNDNTEKMLSGIKKMQKYIELLEQRLDDFETVKMGD